MKESLEFGIRTVNNTAVKFICKAEMKSKNKYVEDYYKLRLWGVRDRRKLQWKTIRNHSFFFRCASGQNFVLMQCISGTKKPH